MSEWTERVRNSAIWKAMEELGPVLDNADSRDGNDAPAVEALGRVRTVLTFVGKRLAAADPLLIQSGPLDNATNMLQSATAEVQQFVADGSIGHLTNANGQMDSVLAYVGQLNVPLAPFELQALKDAADKYREAMERNVRRLSGFIDTANTGVAALEEKLSDLTTQMTAERARLSTITTDFQSQFSTAQESRNNDYTAAQNARQERFSDWATGAADTLAKQEAAFTTAQTSRQEKVAEWVTSAADALAKQDAAFTKDRERLTQEHAIAMTDLQMAYVARAEEVLKEIQRHKSAVEKLVGVIGNLGVTSGYLKTANEAKITARIWQGLAVASMIVLVAVAYFAFLPVVRGSFSWEAFAGRVFFTLTIGVLAAYAASQADRFLGSERRHRILALEFEALGPYLAPLPEDKQQEFRMALADRTFGRDQGDGNTSRSPATVIDVLMKSKEFREFVAEVAKAVRA